MKIPRASHVEVVFIPLRAISSVNDVKRDSDCSTFVTGCTTIVPRPASLNDQPAVNQWPNGFSDRHPGQTCHRGYLAFWRERCAAWQLPFDDGVFNTSFQLDVSWPACG